MNLRPPFRCRSLLLLLCPLLLTRPARATGIEEPIRWLGPNSTLVLDPPEFFFELETKRIAADLHPDFKAIVPPGGPSAREYRKQTDEADAADFEAALKSGGLHPPDPEAARREHRLTMKALGRDDSAPDDTQPPNPSEDSALPSSSPASSSSPPVSPAANISPAPVTNEFPSEFADYHRGALAYQTGDKRTAAEAWRTLLQRPAAERKYRTTWAAYMLGKMALDNQPDEARAHFQKLREAARAGFVDSLGLAAGSIGWEALLQLNAKNFPEAAHLYLEQLATGDPTAVNSLHVLTDQLAEAQPDFTPLLADPLLQRLATAAALSGMGAFGAYEPDAEHPNPANKWLLILEKADAKDIKDADCVAWMQYQKGDYKAAARWLKIADPASPYALWLQAKLALREGKLDLATKFLAKAVPKLPAARALESRDLQYETLPGDESKGDLGLLRVGHADFLAAIRLFVQVQKSDDAEYLAEAVLTIPELKQFIETDLPTEPEKDPETGEAAEDLRPRFRAIIGRRLVRAGQLAEARPYFAEPEQKTIDQYIDLLGKAKNESAAKVARAAAFWTAAQLVQENGDPLFDYALPAAMAERLSGRAVGLGTYPETTITYGRPEKLVPPVTPKERLRLRQNSQPALHRYYANYVAADLGWRAAALMPDNEERTAQVLNTAGSWLKNRDAQAADRFFQAIERRCARTELGREAIKRHWFVPAPEN